jgi:hypothetical protein
MQCGFLDLKFLSECAAKIGGTSNPPHWSMIPKQLAPDLVRRGNRFSDKIMLKTKNVALDQSREAGAPLLTWRGWSIFGHT